MYAGLRNFILGVSLVALSSFALLAQEESGWRISPESINIMVGSERPLQLLDDSAQELHGATWSVDSPDLAEIQQDGDQIVVRAKAAGTVRVSAALGNEIRFREIKIWVDIPEGLSNWAMHPIGREIGDLPAVPTADAPDLYSLEQTRDGRTYLRATTNGGMQVWTWLMPERSRDVELICGDWLGGAVITAKQAATFTLYVVGKNGKLRWQHATSGLRKGLAISTDHLVYLLSQSPDGTSANLTGLDEAAGQTRFEIPLPSSRVEQVRIRKRGSRFTCAGDTVSTLLPIYVSQVMVNMDGYAYVAFTQETRTIGTARCTAGSPVDERRIYLERRDRLVLWQIHPDGVYRSNLVDEMTGKQALSQPFESLAPTTTITTDNENGTLLSVQWLRQAALETRGEPAADFIYRVNAEGNVLYKFQLPRYAGRLHDAIVIGEHDVAFATRGSILIAFNVRTGEDLWHWESNTEDIEVFAALANGHCLVQTPAALMEVADSETAKEVLKGKAMLNWQGQLFVKHN